MPFVDVTLDAAELEQLLERKQHAQREIALAFAVAAEDLVAAVVDRIESEGDGSWPDLAESTIARRRKGGAGAKMLQDRGILKGSIRADSGDDWASASTSVAYIVYHLDGGEVIPKRNPFELRDEVFEDAAQLVAQAVAEAT